MKKSQIDQKCAVTGISVIQGRGCGVHPGGVAAPGPCSEDPVQRCDAGELQPPRLSGLPPQGWMKRTWPFMGVLLYKTRTDPGIGTRRATVIRRISKQELHRSPKYLLPSLHIWPPGSLNNLLIIVILAPLGTLHNKHNDLKIFLLFSRVNAGL
ncbi:uncharacterized protein LOC119505353 isoform X6 [Choloepus didactylus]|uniref:uncharacterized protein LOC119505353 isoform X6 n=1 Tax=Choloepus didactylus TaxID=27675 RepID=UPI0018A0A2B9|nr:uncharacterized protein LOC119505353 isoform X6 [Choloepus didactylus]XP_037653996.1 uncharacterized protein LOC119505353 isoform X6 [Choloepus didactylus]XP_037653997.1 uncharacterized protein LOC119505353 isoform X6 [Choloepus didactylus]XP_037653999.1 uncharacterized protein LOC119505353 isoform X6 [Choloepus didactylus]XP_037654000.1 uncharacterized protein LOC119505353 isoform X6 [Choloepus didactylus]